MNLLFILLTELGEIEPTLSLIERYGILAISVIILALFSFFLVKWVLKKEASQAKFLIDIQKNQNKRLIEIEDKFIKYLEEKDIKDEISSEVLDKHAKINDKIQALLFNLLTEIDADRVMIYEYHNGGKTISGVNFIKCTSTYDATDLGIPSKKSEHGNMPISTHYLWNKILLDKKPIICPNVKFETDKILSRILETDGVKSYYSFLLCDYDGKPIGFMTIEFLSNAKRLSEEEINFLNNQTLTISGLVSFDK